MKIKKLLFLLPLCVIYSCSLWPELPFLKNSFSEQYNKILEEDYKTTINVSSVEELLSTERSTKAGDVLVLIKDGTYILPKSLWLTGNHICYRSASGNRDAVILRGQGMKGATNGIFKVAGNDFRLMDLSLGEVSYHGVQVHGEKDADNAFFKNVRFFNCRQQMIKGSFDKTKTQYGSDNGIVVDCVFEYTAGIAHYYYCGGIDVHNGKNWQVVGNTFRNIISPDAALSEGAVHFWSSSKDTIVDSNIIINCDRGIMFGLDNSPHFGGRISNNFVHVVRDTGIYLCESRNTLVANNTIYLTSDYPNAIEYRFNTSGSEIVNNLSNKKITSRNGGQAVLNANVDSAQAEWFVDIKRGDLHLDTGIDSVVDKGILIDQFSHDIDGNERSENFDLGAHEWNLNSGL